MTNISVVISLLNEEESLPELCGWISKVCNENSFSYEIIMIDDGSTDSSWEIIEKLSSENSNIKGIKFMKNYGKSAAIHEGFSVAKGEVVITMDADLQDNPEEIPELYKMIKEDGFDLVSGWKKKRYDPLFSKNLPSKFFNFIARKVSGLKLHDFNCGFKAYKNKVVKSIEVYGEMHRYIPILVKQAGFKKIDEKVVKHQERKYGKTKFGLSRFINGPLDLLSITFITKFAKRPMHFFGTIGSFSFFAGFVILIYLSIAKLFWQQYSMTERPLFFLGLLAIIFGTQLFLTGLLADLVSRTSQDRNKYQIDKKINLK
ncbi:MAG: glycosyltransferase family 2 protein [Bacteroidales bacterium]|nr:glycosyltransferase family 2 protein [Bacteroidales bacterium]